MSNLRLFLATIFGLGKTSKVRVRRVRIADDEGSNIPPTRQEVGMRNRIMNIITWVMAFALCSCLIAIIAFSALNIDSPSVLAQILFASLGYFGGAFTTFMGVDTQ